MKIRHISPHQWNHANLKQILDKMIGKKVLVVGDVGVDRYTFGSVDRICPEAPVPVLLVTQENLKLGLAANVAENVKVLGGLPLLVGILGSDENGRRFRSLSHGLEINTKYLMVDRSRKTVLKERIVSEGQQLLRVDYESCHSISENLERRILFKIKSLLPAVKSVILQDYAKGLVTRSLAMSITALCKKQGKILASDPHPNSPIEHYVGSYVLTPNLKEASQLSQTRITDLKSLYEAGRKIVRKSHCEYLVITRGKDGMAVFKKGLAQMTLIPTYVREVFDVSGAGDTVISILALALSSGATIEEAAILGNLGAGVVVAKRGTATVNSREIENALEFWSTRHQLALQKLALNQAP